MNAPNPIFHNLALSAAKRRFGTDCVTRLRGTIQADILKEVTVSSAH